MTLWQQGDIFLPPHCHPNGGITYWISITTQTCVPTNLAVLSVVLGSLSILAWLFAQLPQIYKNYKLKSTAGLSIYFLVEWCLGDTANLAGAVLTDQATWQIIIAGYYTFVDLTLVFQYFYFTRLRKQLDARIPRPQTPARPGAPSQQQTLPRTSARPINARTPGLSDYRFPASMSPLNLEQKSSGSSRATRQPAPSTSFASPKTVLMLSMVLAVLSQTQASPLPSEAENSSDRTVREIIGQLVSWSSTALYLGSRLPQLHKNWRRKSTSGLSISLFIAAFFGNLFYSASMLANPLAWNSYGPYGYHGWAPAEGSDQAAWIRLAAPFFLGAAGVLALDAAMALQFYMYGEGKQGPKMLPVPDEDGQKHWERVSGWMRGFIPSPALGPQHIPSAGDTDRRPLLGNPPAQRSYGAAQTR